LFIKYLFYYILLINLFAFILYGIDKRKAIKHQWRISEKVLLCIAIIGGSIGALLGMILFHHKTRHWYFRYGLPVILLIQTVLFLWWFK